LSPLLSVAGLVEMAKGALDAGQEMLHMSEKTGVSVEQLAKFKKAAALTNTDLETVGKSIVKLDKSMVDAFANGKSTKWFDALGISVKDSSGKLRDSNAVMLEVANRFHEMPDGAAKTAIAIGLLGRSGAEMIPLLDMGGDAISKLQTKMTSAFAEKADEYKKKLAALSGQVQILGMDLAEALLPALEKITTAVTSGVEAFNKLPGPVKDLAIGGALVAIAWGPMTALISGSVGVFATVTAGFTAMTEWGAAVVAEFGLVGGACEALGVALMSIPIVGWIAAAAALTVAVYENNEAFRNWANNVVAIVSGDFKNAMKEIGDDANAGFKVVQKAMNDTKYEGQQIAYGLQEAFGNSFAKIAITAKQYFDSITTTILNWWNQIPAPIRGMLSGTGAALKNAAMMIPGVYSTAVAFEALGKVTPQGSKTPKPSPTPNPYNPDLPVGGGGRGANLGKLDTAGIDAMIQEEAIKKQNALLAQQNGIQKEIDADQLLLNQYTHDKNISGELAVKLAIDELEYQKEAVKINADYAKALEDNKKEKNEAVKQAKDENALAAKTSALTKAKADEEKKAKEAAQQYKFTIDDQAKAQKNALEDIANQNKYAMLGATQGKDVEALAQEWDKLNRQVQEHTLSVEYANEQYAKFEKSIKEMQALGNNVNYGLAKGAQDYLNSIGTLADSVGGAVKGTLGQLENALINFVETGKLNFKALADYAVKELARIAIEQAIVGPIAKAFGGFLSGGGSGGLGIPAISGDFYSSMPTGFFTPHANGGIMSAAGPVPLRTYATGGIATSPQMALFGEGSTPEAYVPLPDGRRIPVAMKGGGSSPVVNVAVDAKGTSVTGNSGQASQLGRVIAVAVQNELIKQKRPGGLIAA